MEAAKRELGYARGIRTSYGQFDAKAGYEPNAPHMMNALIVEGAAQLPVLYRNVWNAVQFNQHLVIRSVAKESENGHDGHHTPTVQIMWRTAAEVFSAPGEDRIRMEGVKKILEEQIGQDPALCRRIASVRLEHEAQEWRLRVTGKNPLPPFEATEEERRTGDALADALGMGHREALSLR